MALDVDWKGELQGVEWGDGTPFPLDTRRTRGLDTPNVRDSDVERAGRHGVRSGADLYGRSEIRPVMLIDEDDWLETLDTLKSAWSRSDEVVVLRWRINGQIRRVYGRPRGLASALSRVHVGVVEATGRFVATDPLWYDDHQTSLDLPLAEQEGGLAFPHGFPHGFGGGSAGVVDAHNAGNEATLPHVRIPGPVTGPRLEHVGQGRMLRFNIDVADGDWLDVDFDHQTVLLNGTASRYSTLVEAGWWSLDPGANEIRFAAQAGTTPAQMNYRSAYS